MAGKAVAQHVRMHARAVAVALRPAREAAAHRAWRQARAAARDEQRALVAGRQRGAQRQPGVEGGERGAADRHDPRLAALAGHGGFAGGQIEARIQIQREQFGNAQAGAVEQLEDRPVAHVERVLGRRVEQRAERVRAQTLGQPPRGARGADAVDRIERGAVMAHPPAKEAAPGRQRPRHRARRQTAGMQRGGQAADARGVDGLGRGAVGERGEAVQLAPVGVQGVSAGAALGGEIGQIRVDLRIEARRQHGTHRHAQPRWRKAVALTISPMRLR